MVIFFLYNLISHNVIYSVFQPTVADQARKEFDEASDRLKDLEKSIDDIEKQLGVDLGPEQEFQAIQGQCFEMKDRE